MAPTDYRVATAEELLGAKPPRRREASYLYWARMGRIDQASRNKFEVTRRENVKKVRFLEPEVDHQQEPTRNWDRAQSINRGTLQAGGEGNGEDVSGRVDDNSESDDIDNSARAAERSLKRADRRSAVVEPSAQVKVLKSEEASLPRRA
ncbi:hypothetical protein LTR49_027584 [Elasticomyces elasticus]|nr:hypothetical protein LTR49_027584 [Elasticomyces elasticus]